MVRECTDPLLELMEARVPNTQLPHGPGAVLLLDLVEDLVGVDLVAGGIALDCGSNTAAIARVASLLEIIHLTAEFGTSFAFANAALGLLGGPKQQSAAFANLVWTLAFPLPGTSPGGAAETRQAVDLFAQLTSARILT